MRVCVYTLPIVSLKKERKKKHGDKGVDGGDEIRLLSVKLICESVASSLIQSDTFAPSVNCSLFFSFLKKAILSEVKPGPHPQKKKKLKN